MSNGKGSKPRPYQILTFEENYDDIFRKDKSKQNIESEVKDLEAIDLCKTEKPIIFRKVY